MHAYIGVYRISVSLSSFLYYTVHIISDGSFKMDAVTYTTKFHK